MNREQEANAMSSSCWFWNKKGLNAYADKDDLLGVTKIINGGLTHLDKRKILLNKWKSLVK